MVTSKVVITQDADFEYDPRQYKELVLPIEAGVADVVYGSRFLGGKPQRVFTFTHKLANLFLTFLVNILHNTSITDIETGYKVFRREILSKLNLRSNRFEIEVEITSKVLRNKFTLYEVPITYFGRPYTEGKKIKWRDGLLSIWAIIRYRILNDKVTK